VAASCIARARCRDSSLAAGPVDCALKTVRAEGPLALYKGFAPAYMRLAPWQLVFFYSFEEINKLAGLREL